PPCRWYKGRGAFAASGPHTAWVACGPDIGSSWYSADLYRTTDGGQTWSRIVTLATGLDHPDLEDVGLPFFLDEQYGWVPVCCGATGAGAPGEFLYRTTDGGRSWTNSAGGPDMIRFATPTHGYGTTATALLGTQDGGLHWSVLYSVAPTPTKP